MISSILKKMYQIFKREVVDGDLVIPCHSLPQFAHFSQSFSLTLLQPTQNLCGLANKQELLIRQWNVFFLDLFVQLIRYDGERAGSIS